MKFIDLHSHSTASDGSFSPSELVAKAEEIGLSALALTDHDTVSGLPEFLEAASKNNRCEAIPGVEVSVELMGKEVHIVGLFIDYTSNALLEMLCEIRKHRNQRNELIITKLQGMGFDVTLQELFDVAGGESIGRPLLAKILIEKGYFSEVQEVFDKCLKRGAPAYCARVLPSPDKAINEIHKAGGVAVWAHPLYRAANDRTYLRKMLRELTKFGIDAMEGHYSAFSEAQSRAVHDVAGEFSLLISGGSDFHGTNQKGIELGKGYGELSVPYELLEKLKAKAEQ